MKNKNGIKKALSFLMLCFFFVAVSVGAYAQKTVTGTIKDDGGLPLPGVSIIIKGTTMGTVTGIDGDFSLSNVSNNAVLVFSFIGMETQEMVVGTQTAINVTMATLSIGLEEVVTIGYGTQKKVNLTGSIAMVTAERLENRPISSVGQGMQGVIPNLNITIRNGDPTRSADLNVRGYESINGGSPLVLVDGVPMNMDKLNPNDIQSITVLKDAAAAAIYGSRAAFGVILVETKRGKKGKITVTLGTEQSAEVPIALIDPVIDPYDAAVAWNLATVRTNGAPRYDDDYLAGFLAYKENPTLENEWNVVDGSLRHYAYTDYKSMSIRDFGPKQKYDMSISGATDLASFYVSLGWLKKDGWMKSDTKNEQYNRYNILMKADFKINDWLSLDEQITFNAEHNDKPHFYNWDVNINTVARVAPHTKVTFPDLPYYLEQGDHDDFLPYIGEYWLDDLNFLPYLEDGGRDTETKQDLYLKQGITITPMTGLKFRGDFSYHTYHRERHDVASKIVGVANTSDLNNLYFENGFSGNDWIRNYSDYNQSYVMNAYAEYTLDQFTGHYVKAMVGFNQEWGLNTYIGAQNSTLITPLITDISATTGTQQVYGSRSHVALRGVFYRLNYIFQDKYLIEANGRYDGTSRFPKSDRFGFFPSLSVGWRVSNESFMGTASDWLDNLKIRASYGELGNQLLGSNYYPYISTMGSGMSSYMMNGSGRIPYVSASGLVSPTLTWETVATKNIGVDITTLNQRLDVSFDYYHRDTKDMLMDVEYPSILGTSAPQSNAADLRTKGWELALNWRDNIGQDWHYSLQIALADNQAEIIDYDNPTGALSEYYIGQQMGEIWGYVTEGIFQTDAEVAAHADQSPLGAGWQAGDIMYKDLNGDGVINSGSNTLDDPGDRQVIGNSTARYSFGINPDIQYKNWTLNLFAQGLFRDHRPSNGNWQAFFPFNAGHIENFYLTETWSPDNPDAYFAAPHQSTSDKKNIQYQSRYIQNAAYIRLKSLTLNYNLPSELVKKAGMSRAQIYLSGLNLWEYTKIHAPLDPEQLSTNTQEYYFQRTYSVGIKVTF